MIILNKTLNTMTDKMHTLISNAWNDLLEAKKQANKKRFDEIMTTVIPEL